MRTSRGFRSAVYAGALAATAPPSTGGSPSWHSASASDHRDDAVPRAALAAASSVTSRHRPGSASSRSDRG